MSAADKVLKLAALAASENEHEANAAARQACRLIRDGKVRVTEAERERPRPNERRRPSWTGWEPAPPRPPPPPRGPFSRSRGTEGQSCAACGEPIELGDAFTCAGGFVHGDCVPAAERK